MTYTDYVLLLHCICHELLLGALRADDVLPVRDKALAHHAALARAADKTVVVPVPALKGNEARSTNARDRFATGSTVKQIITKNLALISEFLPSFGEKFSEAVGAVWLVVPAGKPLSGQRLLAVGAGEALPVPGVVPVGHPTLGDHLATLDALCREFFLVAFGAVDVMLLGYKGLCADGVLAGAADEALFVPLPGLVFHLLHPRLENVAAAVATGGELGVIAGAAVDPVRLPEQVRVWLWYFVIARYSSDV